MSYATLNVALHQRSLSFIIVHHRSSSFIIVHHRSTCHATSSSSSLMLLSCQRHASDITSPSVFETTYAPRFLMSCREAQAMLLRRRSNLLATLAAAEHVRSLENGVQSDRRSLTHCPAVHASRACIREGSQGMGALMSRPYTPAIKPPAVCLAKVASWSLSPNSPKTASGRLARGARKKGEKIAIFLPLRCKARG